MRLCGLSLAILVAILALLFAILTKISPKQLPNTSQDCFQDHPNEPQTPKKPAKVMEGCSFSHFDYFPNNHSKVEQKYSQNHPKSSKLQPTWPSWPHCGTPWAPIWSILRASCAHFRINFAKTLANIAPKTQRNGPHTPQDLQNGSKITKNT